MLLIHDVRSSVSTYKSFDVILRPIPAFCTCSEFQSTSVFCLSFGPILIVKSTFFSIKMALKISFQPCIGLYASYFSFSVKKKNRRRFEKRTGEFSLLFQYSKFQSTSVFCLSFGPILIVKSTFFSIKIALKISFQPCIGLYASYFSFSVKKKESPKI